MDNTNFEQEDILDYDETVTEIDNGPGLFKEEEKAQQNDELKDFSDNNSFLGMELKVKLLSSIEKCGFEVPSWVQRQCIPKAKVGLDILCQAKSGMGKTGVFVMSTLQCLEENSLEHSVLVIAPTRELAKQINSEYERIGKDLSFKSMVFTGGDNFKKDIKALNKIKPQIIIGTPGKLKDLILHKDGIKGENVKHFVIDECDLALKDIGMYFFHKN